VPRIDAYKTAGGGSISQGGLGGGEE